MTAASTFVFMAFSCLLFEVVQSKTYQSCMAALEDGEDDSGVQNIDPDGDGSVVAFDAYCDQESNGGGWMLVATRRHDSNPKSIGVRIISIYLS